MIAAAPDTRPFRRLDLAAARGQALPNPHSVTADSFTWRPEQTECIGLGATLRSAIEASEIGIRAPGLRDSLDPSTTVRSSSRVRVYVGGTSPSGVLVGTPTAVS